MRRVAKREIVPPAISSPLQEIIPILETVSDMTAPSHSDFVFGDLGHFRGQFLDDGPALFTQRCRSTKAGAAMVFIAS